MGAGRKRSEVSKLTPYSFRVYLLSGLDGVGNHDKQMIDCEFTDTSLDLRILKFNGKNLRLKVGPLNGLI